MQNEISFYSDELGRTISCIYSAFGGLLTVTTPDGRQQLSQLGSSSSPVTQARIMLIEMERGKKANPRCVAKPGQVRYWHLTDIPEPPSRVGTRTLILQNDRLLSQVSE